MKIFQLIYKCKDYNRSFIYLYKCLLINNFHKYRFYGFIQEGKEKFEWYKTEFFQYITLWKKIRASWFVGNVTDCVTDGDFCLAPAQLSDSGQRLVLCTRWSKVLKQGDSGLHIPLCIAFGETRRTKMAGSGNSDAGCSILKKFGLQPVTRCSLAKFYAPAFGVASYTAMSVNVMNPSLVIK